MITRAPMSPEMRQAKLAMKRARDRERHRRRAAILRESPVERGRREKHAECQRVAQERHKHALKSLGKVTDEQLANGLAGLHAARRYLAGVREQALRAGLGVSRREADRAIAKAQAEVERWETALGVRVEVGK